MSKIKTTRKELKESYTLLECGYANLQYLLRYENARYYCTRAEGWAFDAYIFGDYAIIDGYSPIGKPVDRELMRKYDEIAKEMLEEHRSKADFSQEAYYEITQRLRNLISDFLGDANKRKGK